MAKFYGAIGYAAAQTETSPGVWTDQIIEKKYRGDVLQNNNRWQRSDNLNDNFAIDNKLSIIADQFAYDNFAYVKYVQWMGTKWKVNSIEVLRPRLLLSIGGVYNGATP